jgi:Predicted oxidoreductases (related to aryl-alcohol dehydrogenases)
LNWLKTRPTVSSILIGARNEQQLLDNLAAKDWSLSVEQLARLDAVSAVYPPYPYYPYWNGQFTEKNPTLVTSAFISEHTAE